MRKPWNKQALFSAVGPELRGWVFSMLFVLEQHLDVESSMLGTKVLSWLISPQSISEKQKSQAVAAEPYGSVGAFNMIRVRLSE